jgi:uncharacterized protein
MSEPALTVQSFAHPEPRGGGWFSIIEFVVGAIIVIGHNVFHRIPNEVPILFVLGLLSFAIRNRSLKPMGLALPASWRKTILIALAAAAVRIVVGQFVLDPVTAHFWPPAKAPAGMNEIAHNWKIALEWLALIWTFAAFGEELSYRGYLLNRAADVLGRSRSGYLIAIIASAVLFGYGHYYKGPAGIVDSGFAGLVLGAAFLLSGKSLWTCILAHGLIDTFGVVCVFMGWAN